MTEAGSGFAREDEQRRSAEEFVRRPRKQAIRDPSFLAGETPLELDVFGCEHLSTLRDVHAESSLFSSCAAQHERCRLWSTDIRAVQRSL